MIQLHVVFCCNAAGTRR